MSDPYNLERFILAQGYVYDAVVRELTEGQKRTHWMWFIFPQLAGLGSSPMARRYALRDRGEALAYLAHPVLGRRLIEGTKLVNETTDRSVREIFGYPDDLKFRSCMTLFAQVSTAEPCFAEALRLLFDGEPDRLTLGLLAP